MKDDLTRKVPVSEDNNEEEIVEVSSWEQISTRPDFFC